MTGLQSRTSGLTEMQGGRLHVYLEAAAKMVETVAFEAAREVPSQIVQDLLSLACAIEHEAEGMKERAQIF